MFTTWQNTFKKKNCSSYFSQKAVLCNEQRNNSALQNPSLPLQLPAYSPLPPTAWPTCTLLSASKKYSPSKKSEVLKTNWERRVFQDVNINTQIFYNHSAYKFRFYLLPVSLSCWPSTTVYIKERCGVGGGVILRLSQAIADVRGVSTFWR